MAGIDPNDIDNLIDQFKTVTDFEAKVPVIVAIGEYFSEIMSDAPDGSRQVFDDGIKFTKFLRLENPTKEQWDQRNFSYANEYLICEELHGSHPDDRHPNILEIDFFGMSGDGFWIQGSNFAGNNLLAEALNPNALPQIFLQVAEALQFAHDSNVIHCDLKPSNIAVKNDTATILDWAGGRLIKNMDLASAGVIESTPFYEPPETRFATERPFATAAMDTYSFGVTMFETLQRQGINPLDSPLAHVIEGCLKPLADRIALPQAIDEISEIITSGRAPRRRAPLCLAVLAERNMNEIERLAGAIQTQAPTGSLQIQALRKLGPWKPQNNSRQL